jgi:hypothetical protein
MLAGERFLQLVWDPDKPDIGIVWILHGGDGWGHFQKWGDTRKQMRTLMRDVSFQLKKYI